MTTTKPLPKDTIFATGVHLQAIEVEINGIKQWRWVATSFEEDTYFDGKIIDVLTYANDRLFRRMGASSPSF